MAWFRKDKKPRPPGPRRLEIPADAWEKCEACAHTDIREKFVRNSTSARRATTTAGCAAVEYAPLLLDDDKSRRTTIELASVDPLEFPE